MKPEDTNRLIITILSSFLLFYIFIKSISSLSFNPLEIMAGYFILLYDIISSILFLIKSKNKPKRNKINIYYSSIYPNPI